MTLDMLTARFEELTVFSPAVQAALGGLVSAGLMQQSSRDAIEALATETISPALEAEIGPRVHEGWLDWAETI